MAKYLAHFNSGAGLPVLEYELDTRLSREFAIQYMERTIAAFARQGTFFHSVDLFDTENGGKYIAAFKLNDPTVNVRVP